ELLAYRGLARVSLRWHGEDIDREVGADWVGDKLLITSVRACYYVGVGLENTPLRLAVHVLGASTDPPPLTTIVSGACPSVPNVSSCPAPPEPQRDAAAADPTDAGLLRDGAAADPTDARAPRAVTDA